MKDVNRKFLRLFLPCIFMATLLVSGISAGLTYFDLQRNFLKNNELIASSYRAALVSPLWNFEEGEIIKLLEALNLKQDVVRATVSDMAGKLIAEVGNGANEEVFLIEKLVEHHGKLQNYPLGKLQIEFSDKRIQNTIYYQALRDGLLLLILGMVAIVFASFLNRHVIARLEVEVAERTRHLDEEIERRKKIEEELQMSHRTIEASPDHISIVDTGYNYQIVNPAYEESFGLSRDQIVGKPISSLFGEQQFQETIKPHLDKCFTGEDVNYQSWLNFPAKGRCFMSVTYLPIYDNDIVVGVAVLAHDITLQKEISEEHMRAKEVAENANRTKSQFLAAASHDLRQPLQAISMLLGALSDSLRGEGLQDKKQHFKILDGMERSVESLRELLSSLLDLSKLDAGVVKVNKYDFFVEEIIEDVQEDLILHSKEKGIEPIVVHSSMRVSSDPVLLKQILDNLISNALKYTETGKILLGCRREGDRLRIEVWDTGIGIREENVDVIFEEFHQINNPSRQREKGLGLGLAIIKRTSEMIGAEVAVRSTFAKGSVFSVSVPLAKEQFKLHKKFKPNDEIQHVNKGTLMVVDDDMIVLEGTSLLLSGWGYDVIEASSAQEALHILERTDAHIDGLILDYQLPKGENGLDLYQQIQQQMSLSVPGVIISGATTSFALDEFENCSLQHLTKPINTDELKTTISNMLLNYV